MQNFTHKITQTRTNWGANEIKIKQRKDAILFLRICKQFCSGTGLNEQILEYYYVFFLVKRTIIEPTKIHLKTKNHQHSPMNYES